MADVIRIETGLLCDDIRREDNGKMILIGVYGRNLVPSSFPATFVISCLVIGVTEQMKETSLDFRAIFDGNVVWEAQGSSKADYLGKTLIPLQNILVTANAPGRLEIAAKEGDGDWEPFTFLPIERPPAPPNPSQKQPLSARSFPPSL